MVKNLINIVPPKKKLYNRTDICDYMLCIILSVTLKLLEKCQLRFILIFSFFSAYFSFHCVSYFSPNQEKQQSGFL